MQPDSNKPDQPTDTDAKPAVDLIRHKIDELYAEEPSAKAEILDTIESNKPHSKHQQFMYDLSTSGKSLAEIQTAWHEYYASLPDNEKHQVWEEFYTANSQSARLAHYQQPSPQPEKSPSQPATSVAPARKTHSRSVRNTRSVGEIKQSLLKRTKSRGKYKPRQHLQSLMFGLGLGSFVLLLLLFGFFNERFIAPFISPSRHVNSTPIIIDPNNTAVDPQPKIIIPKINVEIPVVYDETSIEEKAFQKALEGGVVHYATTPNPGEKGNAVIFGHSSNNIFNQGKYKFAFVLLSRLESGDLFYLNKNSKRYAYRVYKKEIVKPDNVGVLGSTDKLSTVTLITCDPPGTSISRLIVIGEQISPDPVNNGGSSALQTDRQPTVIPSNAPSLWQRFKAWLGQ